MTNPKNIVIEPAASAALQWHFGIVTEPPSDRVGKEYLAQHLSARYHLEGNTLVCSILPGFGLHIELHLDSHKDGASGCPQTTSRKPKKSRESFSKCSRRIFWKGCN